MIIIEIDGVRGKVEDLLQGYPFSEELRAAYDAAGELYPQREEADGHLYVSELFGRIERAKLIEWDDDDSHYPPGAKF